MSKAVLTICLLLTVTLSAGLVCATALVWPAAPAEPRVEFVRQISLADLKPQAGFLGRIGRFLGGSTPDEELSHPFNLMVAADHLYLTCQGRKALIVVDLARNTFRLRNSRDLPLVSPIGLARLGETVYLADSGSRAVYRLIGDDLEPWITTGLVRPTGLAALVAEQLILVVDTGDHRLKFFDLDGHPVRTAGRRGEQIAELNFPTFAAPAGNDVLINDTLNYQVKRYDGAGRLLGSFGEEGDGPGTFARPKGLAVDSAGNTWVVDALFDNVQVFDDQGRLLLVIGGPGQAPGEFWSPVGIAIRGDEVFIADTFNHRIQVLRSLEGDS